MDLGEASFGPKDGCQWLQPVESCLLVRFQAAGSTGQGYQLFVR